MNEDRNKYLEFIQNIINRLNSNSFLIKGWAITIISALVILYETQDSPSVLITILIPLIVFWILDALYLQQERKYRLLYDRVIRAENEILLFDLDTNKEFINTNKKSFFWNVFWSKSLRIFYLSLSLILTLSLYFLYSSNNKMEIVNVSVSFGDTLTVKELQNLNSGIVLSNDKEVLDPKSNDSIK